MKHRILFISTIVPYPPDRGHRIRIYHLLKQLSTSFHVGLLTMTFTEEEYRNAELLRLDLPGIVPYHIVRSPAHENGAARIKGICSSLIHSFPFKPREMYYHAPVILRQAVRSLVHSFDPHLIQCVYWFTRGAVPPGIEIPVWIDSIDINWRRASLLPNACPLHPASFFNKIRVRSIRNHEYAAYDIADRVLAIQEAEAAILGTALITPVSTLPISCDIPDEPLRRTPEPVVCFIGPMDYHPNYDAVKFLSEDVLPRVRDRAPGTRLRVIGRTDGVRVLPREEWIEYTGHVSDLDSVLKTVAIGVAPVRLGSGVNVKVITMLGRGLPLIATSNAVEGLSLKDGVEYLRAENAPDFASNILEVLADPSRAESLSLHGHSFAKQSHDWRTNTPIVTRFYQNALRDNEIRGR